MTVIIIDFNQVCISNLMMQLGSHQNAKIEESLVRHMVLNSIRSFKQKFAEYGDIVIACDDKNFWRRQIFPYYKANRKKTREQSDIDWATIFECFAKIRQELSDHFPYRVLKIESAEADDIIASLVHKYGSPLAGGERILILSGDKDFIQLQYYANVEQYDPVRKKFIRHNNPQQYLKEHILKGDAGDGVPNFLSADDCFVTGTRQTPIRQTNLSKWTACSKPEEFCTDAMLRGYKRNQLLVDLSCVPQEIQNMVIEQYESQANKKKTDLLPYFINHRLKQLSEYIGDF